MKSKKNKIKRCRRRLTRLGRQTETLVSLGISGFKKVSVLAVPWNAQNALWHFGMPGSFASRAFPAPAPNAHRRV